MGKKKYYFLQMDCSEHSPLKKKRQQKEIKKIRTEIKTSKWENKADIRKGSSLKRSAVDRSYQMN